MAIGGLLASAAAGLVLASSPGHSIQVGVLLPDTASVKTLQMPVRRTHPNDAVASSFTPFDVQRTGYATESKKLLGPLLGSRAVDDGNKLFAGDAISASGAGALSRSAAAPDPVEGDAQAPADGSSPITLALFALGIAVVITIARSSGSGYSGQLTR